ncbi:DNA-directed RNA polymerase, subunit RPC12/RpoP, contains C4-type Zn-finger [Granulicatella balaenopterae]|uniref:DNA-directed RNA polymerase, subunit RPC12/RpoP, contains C4-type Zn-finger n=1 Tax=Granulicatella balaenopterae TaxID=137733 RepID=A0A1H9IRS3_9LACT|nr:hypothetical protein [Granulicatella balaenopterae]SEQ77217.1 DNA-directed RNA polymerase, subunit RPC12/RpoP, contains C4-type Zn-finger [Granulicatella balaenopterae]
MSHIEEYKCPACGGAMEFDSNSQQMSCPYCDTKMSVEEFEVLAASQNTEESTNMTSQNGAENQQDSVNWQSANEATWEAGETDGMRIYQCESCGGEIIAEETSGATTCPYCDNRIVMKGQFSGDLKPDYIIPFKLNKKDAKAAYFEHLKDKIFLPRVFKAQNHIDEIKGIYVPFWLFDVDCQAQITYDCERVRRWRSGDTEYTETDYFLCEREGCLSFDHIPTDASAKMADDLMESVEPYNFTDAIPFKAAYLAGYLADRYDVNMEERFNRAKERVTASCEDEFRRTVEGYTSVGVNTSSVTVNDAKYFYSLYPVWILNTSWNGKNYLFAMNGQTGKIVGDLPVDKSLFYKYIGIRGSIFSVGLIALTMLIHFFL